MFERNKNAENDSNNNESTSVKRSSKNLGSVNMVSEGTEIVGKLITQNDIRIAGNVDGEAKVEGKVIVASSGHVEGNVNATNADIAGRVEGEVHVNSKLTLRESAVVECDIYTQNLVVEEGATFNGACHMRGYKSNKSKSKDESKSKKKELKKKEIAKDSKGKVNP